MPWVWCVHVGWYNYVCVLVYACECICGFVYVYMVCMRMGCVCAYGVMCVYASSGQKFPDVLVALLLLEWTLDDPLCCCCGDC